MHEEGIMQELQPNLLHNMPKVWITVCRTNITESEGQNGPTLCKYRKHHTKTITVGRHFSHT